MSAHVNGRKIVNSIPFNLSQKWKVKRGPPAGRWEGKGVKKKKTTKKDEKNVERIWMKALVYALEHDYELENDPVTEEMYNEYIKDP